MLAATCATTVRDEKKPARITRGFRGYAQPCLNFTKQPRFIDLNLTDQAAFKFG